MNDNSLPGRFHVQIDGIDLPPEAADALLEITVETNLRLPAVASILINDPDLHWIDDARFACGKTVTIFAAHGATDKPLFDGEIVEVEPDLAPATKRLLVRAFDRLHRLGRGRHVRSFQNITDGDLVQKLAREAGLTAQVGPTRQVHAYLLQANQTNLELLRQRASALGYFLYVEGKTLFCQTGTESGAASPPVELSWGAGLSEFRPRLSTVGQVDEVIVRGWDPSERKEIIGLAASAAGGAPQTGSGDTGGASARKAFNVAAQHLVTDRPVRSQTEADVLARAAADAITGQFIEAEGAASGGGEGVANLRAGRRVKISGVGDRFGGTYTVTSATHHYAPHDGHTIRFTVSGAQTATLAGCLLAEGDALPASSMAYGAMPFLAVGIVTDNDDPLQQGRVKVRFPLLSGEHASDWSRVVAPGGGAERGFLCLPEVNDEVLVGFEQGDIHHPYVLGGLWNGRDAPPPSEAGGPVARGGVVQERVWQSRSGHRIALTDTEGSECVTIKDRNGNEIVLDSAKNALRCTFKGDATLQAQGKLTLESTGGSVEIKAAAGVTVDGGGGDAVVKGTLVRLN